MKLRIHVRAVQAVVAILAVTLAVLLGLLALRHWETAQTTDSAAEQTAAATQDLYADEDTQDLLYLDGGWYAPREDLETVLVLGLDSDTARDTEGEYRNDALADFLLLLLLDRSTGQTQAIQLNRDTMAEIPILGVTGKAAGSFTGQLALAHTYGSGGTDSCENTVQAVSDLLYGVKIDHYVSMTMDGVAILNDLAGGVTLEVLDDFSQIDESLVQGQTVTLTGQQALTYVRSRAGLEDSSNLRRMDRQVQYLAALQTQLAACVSQDAGFILTCLADLSEQLVSDCTAEALADLGQTLADQPVDTYWTLTGEAVQGETYMEYYVDEEALRDLVLELFYTPVQVE